VSWLKLDDGFARHPKVTALTYKDRWTWMAVLCYCARYRTDGYLPANIREHVAGATPKFLHGCVSLELLDGDGDELRVHDWQMYAPKDPTGAERQAAWRNKKRNGDITARVTATRARSPVPSPSPEAVVPLDAARCGQPPTFRLPKLKEMP